MTDITILMVSNVGIDLDLLNSIMKHTKYPYQLKLLANNPCEDVIGFLSQDKYPYHITHFDDERYKVWNYGCEISDTEYVCFMMDSGVIVLENWLTNMMKHANGESIIIAPHILTNDKILYDFWHDFDFKYIEEPFLYHDDCQSKYLSDVLTEEYHGQTDDNIWLKAWITHRTSFPGWCTDLCYPANMDIITLNTIKSEDYKLIRALDAGIFLFD